MSRPVQVVRPEDVPAQGDSGGFPFDLYERRCLAQGDSWFSIGAFPPPLTSNVIGELRTTRATAVVNCGRPSKTLQHMNDTTREPWFVNLLAGNIARRWDAVLISGGGNDLIDAARVGPQHPADRRLLLAPSERPASPAGAADYLSAGGWCTFEAYLTPVFHALVRLRDRRPLNRGVPMLFQTYAATTPRPSPAAPGFGPWLEPAMRRFVIPTGHWFDVSRALTHRLAALLARLIDERTQADPATNLHLVDTRSAPLRQAAVSDTGVAGDFQNEIHLTRRGYRKVAVVWQSVLDPILR